jgi:polysaccharide pyruvyl transferase WcaK-like protein
VNAAIIREEVSMNLLKHIGVTVPLYRCVDSSFAFNPKTKYDLREKFSVKQGQLLFGLTARQWLSNEKQSKYESALAKTIDHIVAKYGAMVVLIPQVTAEFHNDDDRVVNNRIAAMVKQPESVIALNDKLSHSEIKAAYNSLDYLIGTRFHSVIFALTSRVPALAIEYEHKTGGIMHDLQLDKWVIGMEKVRASQLIQKIDTLVDARQAYIEQIQKVLPRYIERTTEPIEIVKKEYKKASIS